ncbi:PREDICTED: protogenin-like [Papilio xuthus]|uniref:Protogenin-like n=1 Tax=Papilio xuthus TaxID=66420 RepID=A0AAJ6ZMV0_PAPXU|nr:PREDICTED: protogenin-like [Papilio xuthus]
MSLQHVFFLAYVLKTYASDSASPELRDEPPSLVPLVPPESPVPLGPVLREVPPALVPVSATGARLRCTADGDPAPRISWLAADGSELSDEPGVRRVLGDGSLQVWVSGGGRGSQMLRCRAVNTRGAVLSHPVTLMSVPAGGLAAVVEARGAAAGGVAVLHCRTQGAGAGAVRDVVWYRSGAELDTAAGSVTILKLYLSRHRLSAEPRYFAAGDTLLIRDMSPADAAPYSCAPRTPRTPLAPHAARSLPAPLLLLPSGGRGGAPRLPATGELTAASGDRFCLTCAAPDFPPPHYT